MMVSGNLNAHEIEKLMDSEIDTHHQEEHAAVAAIAAPGRRPAGLRHRGRGAGRGQHHGLGGPAAGGAGRHDRLGAGRHLPGHPAGLRLRRAAGRPAGAEGRGRGKELQCIKTTLLASMQGYAPQVAIEFGRKVLYSTDRPTFTELEAHVKGKK
jgi:chemotaxis protein MotA